MEFSQVQVLIDQDPDLADFVGGVADSEIADAEQRLAVKFPRSYVAFLHAYGCGNFGPEEFYGLGVPDKGVPSMLWYTERSRQKEATFPASYVVVYNAGQGEILCLATDQIALNGECPVISWQPGAPHQALEVVAESFADLMGQMVKSVLDEQ